ncbi:MAG TPA: hypothetical protein VF242_13505, partial [Nitrososphaeraceae archaeon]
MLYNKKEQIKFTLIICISLILVTGSLIQLLPTNPFRNNDILIKIPLISAEDDDDGDDDCRDDDNGDDDCRDDDDDDNGDDDCRDDDDGGNINSKSEQDTDNESVGNDEVEDTIKNFTDNDNGGISTPAEDSSTSPSLPPSSSTTILQNDNDTEILTPTITNEKQSTPDNNN